MEVNRQHKDRLFRLLFGQEENKSNILSLYNALRGTSYTDVDLIELTTIDDAVYIGMKNDVSFIIDSYMPLWEQQSTYNPNMPIRGFMYYAKLYDSYISRIRRSLYGTTRIMLPTPQYVILYNGDEERPCIEKLKLSDSFTDKSVSSEYEWTATAYNLNDKRNQKLLDACKPLSDYMYVVEHIKESWQSNLSKEDALKAVDNAIKECIQKGVLPEFLIKHRAEVIDVCLTEFDEKKYAETLIADGMEKGMEKGMKKGIAKIVLQMLSSGKTPEEIHAFCEIPLSDIEKIQKEGM